MGRKRKREMEMERVNVRVSMFIEHEEKEMQRVKGQRTHFCQTAEPKMFNYSSNIQGKPTRSEYRLNFVLEKPNQSDQNFSDRFNSIFWILWFRGEF